MDRAVRMFLVAAIGVMVASSATYGTNNTPVTEEGIAISLPVFFASLISVIVATWTIAQYDRKRVREMDDLIRRLERLETGRPVRSPPSHIQELRQQEKS